MATALETRPLTQSEARELTDRIRSTAENLSGLLYEAHEGKAYRALGYATWAEYASAEFSISRTHSHALLAQATVMHELGEAAGKMSCVQDISIRAAQDVRPVLSDVVEQVRNRVEQGQEPLEAVREAVAAARPVRNGKEPHTPVLEPTETEEERGVDPVAEWERAERENEELRRQVESLSASDLGSEVAAWQKKYTALSGRLDLALRQKAEAERTARYQAEILGKLRKLLSVESNGEVVGAVTDLLR